jgi:DNA-binding LacI/PurR family transcriptional regulator
VIVGNALHSVPSVSIDHHQGIRDAVTHLHQLGHEHIAFVSGAGETETTRLRRQGFLDAAEALGLFTSSVYASYGSLSGATTVAEDILKTAPRTTAIVAASDYVAVGVLHGLFDKAYQVPRDISVIGFDNVQISQFLCPALTTMDADIPQLASVACERLYSLMTDPASSPDPLVLAPHLVLRQSTGIPRSVDAGT